MQQIEALAEYYEYQRYHESLNNVAPADVHTGRAASILEEGERIKERILKKKRISTTMAIRQTAALLLVILCPLWLKRYINRSIKNTAHPRSIFAYAAHLFFEKKSIRDAEKYVIIRLQICPLSLE
jgi:hypothetical protein